MEFLKSIVDNLLWIILIIVGVILISISYVKASPEEAIIVSGLKRRVISGKAGLVFPFLERKDRLSLKMMSVDVRTKSFVPTNDFINIMVDGAVKIQIGETDTMIARAAQNFLNERQDETVNAVVDVLEANMREIIGQMKLKEMVVDRKTFGEKVMENAVPDLENMGLKIIAFNIQNFSDDQGLINDLGIDNIEQIRKDAAIAKAQAKQEIDIETAKAKQKANDQQVIADNDIAEKQNQLEIRRSELRIEAERKRAEAEAAFGIQNQLRRKDLENVTADAEAVRAQRSILITKDKLEAEIRTQADAQNYQRREEAKAVADATLLAAQAEAEAIRIRGQAEADATQAKGLAEAAAIDSKALAMQKFGEAAILEMYLKTLPQVAENIAMPLSNIDKITMFGEGNNTRLITDIVNSMTKIDEGLQTSLGLDIKKLLSKVTGHTTPNEE